MSNQLSEYAEQIECLEKTVKEALKAQESGAAGAENAEYSQNATEYLKKMQEDLANFSALIKGERSPTVGVFGCPSRGKSTLVNVLLGTDLLPMAGRPGTTRFGTELWYKDSKDFTITVKYINKTPRIARFKEVESIKDELVFIAEEANFENPDIAKIEIEGPFQSFLGNDIVFVDTPGVELGVSKDELENLPGELKTDTAPIMLDRDFAADTRRALAILSSADIVIFCMILKYKERKDAEFYRQYIKNLTPINVINAGDARDDGQTDDDIKRKLQQDYRLIRENTVIVSSKNALEIIREAKKAGKDIRETVEKEFAGENLESFKILRDKLREKIEKKDEYLEGRITHFQELYDGLKSDAAEHGIELPKRITSISGIEAIKPIIKSLIAKGTLTDENIQTLRRMAVEKGLAPDDVVALARQMLAEIVDPEGNLPPDLLELIEIVADDGIISEEEKELLTKKAEEHGLAPEKIIKIAQERARKISGEGVISRIKDTFDDFKKGTINIIEGGTGKATEGIKNIFKIFKK
jgi:GTPase Era involved in 16S rRNA processing